MNIIALAMPRKITLTATVRRTNGSVETYTTVSNYGGLIGWLKGLFNG